ncbi:CatB-related O-acetyltransferase [uncultured Aliivibrio sp.]|uniref:CatB-related O-acetyltransferase n=1 Tax=uncultured Aliivibrio sp. TaxID=873085 RepID=UPI00260B6E4E|nr:CatB-related O-acetyltransferase [uncultured Aliivibrio sp.]
MLTWLKGRINFFLLKRRFIDCVIYNGVTVDKQSFISNDCVLFQHVTIVNSNIGDRSYIQKNSVISSTCIGKYCSIASNVTIGLASHPLNMVSTSPIFYDNSQPLPYFFTDKVSYEENCPKTIIDSDVWIGQGAIIKAGIHIGVGAVIGAGAVVVKDVEPYSIVGGCPSVHLKWRFEEPIRTALVNSKWWDLDDEQLALLTPLFIQPSKLLTALNQDK